MNQLPLLYAQYESIRRELLSGTSVWNVKELHADLDATLIAINDALNAAPNIP